MVQDFVHLQYVPVTAPKARVAHSTSPNLGLSFGRRLLLPELRQRRIMRTRAKSPRAWRMQERSSTTPTLSGILTMLQPSSAGNLWVSSKIRYPSKSGFRLRSLHSSRIPSFLARLRILAKRDSVWLLEREHEGNPNMQKGARVSWGLNSLPTWGRKMNMGNPERPTLALS